MQKVPTYVNEKHSLTINKQIYIVTYEKSGGKWRHAVTQEILK